MAERERLTNKERREQARAERKQRDAEAAKQRQRGAWRNGAITLAIVAVVVAVVIQAITGGTDPIDDAILVSASDAEDAREAAGCEYLTENQPLEDRTHVDNSNEINPDTAYTGTRPTHSGPHTSGMHPITPRSSSQIEEVSTTHNLEHGSIIAWWDPDQVESSTSSQIGDWAETLNVSGFRRTEAGVGILSSPYEDPGISSGKSVAFRAWGVAMDCDEWDETVANAFVLEHFGTSGIAPERTAAGFPVGVLEYEEGDAAEEETSEDDAEQQEDSGDEQTGGDDAQGGEDGDDQDDEG